MNIFEIKTTESQKKAIYEYCRNYNILHFSNWSNGHVYIKTVSNEAFKRIKEYLTRRNDEFVIYDKVSV